MKIVISSGHGKYIRGASGYLDEVDEARKIVEEIANYLKNRYLEVEVDTFHDDTSTSQSTNLSTIVNYHNAQTRDLDVSVHLNAYETTDGPMGTEVLYVTQDLFASHLSDVIAQAGEFLDRGAKYRSDLYFLNETEAPSILIETCFVDSAADTGCYRANFENICSAIADVLVEFSLGDEPPLSKPSEPAPPSLTGTNVIDITGATQGEIAVIINNQLIRGRADCHEAVVMQIRTQGDVTVTLNGQNFHRPPTIPSNQCAIIATVFGGEEDYNTSAYDPDKVLDDSDLYIALPNRFEGERPAVRVYNRASGLSVMATIEDVGPWNIDDAYWETGTRPQAESGTDNSGRTTNGAGIDLSPALAQALLIEGKGKVDWEFI